MYRCIICSNKQSKSNVCHNILHRPKLSNGNEDFTKRCAVNGKSILWQEKATSATSRKLSRITPKAKWYRNKYVSYYPDTPIIQKLQSENIKPKM